MFFCEWLSEWCAKWKEQHMGCAEANWAQPSCVCCSWPQWKGVFACPKRFSKQVVPRKSRLMVCLHSQVLGWQCSLDSCIWLGCFWFLSICCLLGGRSDCSDWEMTGAFVCLSEKKCTFTFYEHHWHSAVIHPWFTVWLLCLGSAGSWVKQ